MGKKDEKISKARENKQMYYCRPDNKTQLLPTFTKGYKFY